MKRTIALLIFLLMAGCSLPVQAQRRREGTREPARKGKENPPKSPLEYSLDTIVMRLDNLHLTLNRINDFNTLGLNTKKVEEQLPGIGDNIEAIADKLSLHRTVPDFKTLQLYEVLLQKIQQQLEGWRNSLFRYNVDLISMNNEIDAFTHDSLIRQMVRDSAFRRMYTDEINVLGQKWRQADTATHNHLERITKLQSLISKDYFQTIDLQNQVEVLRNQLSGRIFNKEYAYLWEFTDTGSVAGGTGTLAAQSYNGQRRIMGYFIRENWANYAYVVILGLLFFLWVWNSFRRIERSPDRDKLLESSQVNYLRKYPVAGT